MNFLSGLHTDIEDMPDSVATDCDLTRSDCLSYKDLHACKNALQRTLMGRSEYNARILPEQDMMLKKDRLLRH